MSRSQFHSIKLFILRHAWLNLWDKHMTTGRINQVTLFCTTIACKQKKGQGDTPPDPAFAHMQPDAHRKQGTTKPHTRHLCRSKGRRAHVKIETLSTIRDEFSPSRAARTKRAATLWFFRHFSMPVPSYEASAGTFALCHALLAFAGKTTTNTKSAASWYTAGCVQVTQLNTRAQLQEQATTGRLANEFQFMLTHQVLIQTFPPATAAGDTSGPITAAARFPLRAHSDLACTSSRKHSWDSWNHCSYIKDRAFRQLRQHFCTNPLRKVSFQISQLQKAYSNCIHTLLY